MKLSDIKIEVDKLAAKIDAPDMFLPTYGYSRDGAWPHIEVKDNLLYYVVIERGKELKRNSTTEINELLYWIFDSATFSMAGKYELAHREEARDFRRIMFAHQEKLLGLLYDTWQEKKIQEHQKILEKHPFDDLAGLRARYFATLRREGYKDEIEKLAYEKYPSIQ
jgi:hypothetical protein